MHYQITGYILWSWLETYCSTSMRISVLLPVYMKMWSCGSAWLEDFTALPMSCTAAVLSPTRTKLSRGQFESPNLKYDFYTSFSSWLKVKITICKVFLQITFYMTGIEIKFSKTRTYASHGGFRKWKVARKVKLYGTHGVIKKEKVHNNNITNCIDNWCAF